MTIVSRYQVQAIGRHTKREMRGAPPMAVWAATAKRVVEGFVGSDWISRHLSTTPDAFFQGYDAPRMQDNAGARRVIELAEMLLNLQGTRGFEEPLEKLKDDKLETAFAALEAAKLLHRSRTRFEFVTPQGVKGADYDIEAFPENGPAVPIEAKCKLISTAVVESGVKSTLERARVQLPEKRPGVVIIRIPREWGGDDFIINHFRRSAEKLLRESSRVAGVIAFTNVFSVAERSHASFLAAKDIWSKRPEFSTAPSWKLVRSDFFDENDAWMRIRLLLGDKPHLGVTAEQVRRRLGINH